MAINILEHRDGVVGHHPDREGHARQTDHVDAAAKQLHEDERGDNADRDRQANDHDRPQTLQKQQQNHHGQRAAGVDVAFHKGRRRIQILRLIIHLFQIQPLGRQNALVQLFTGNPQVRTVNAFAFTQLQCGDLSILIKIQLRSQWPHDFLDVGVRCLLRIDGEGIQSHLADNAVGLAIGHLHLCHITHSHRGIVTRGNDRFGHLFRAGELSQRPHDVTLFAFRNVTC